MARRSTFAKDPDPLPVRPPETANLLISDLPDELLPAIPDPSQLTKVGEVCGQVIYARRELVEQARAIQERMGDRKWPSDALRATIYALRLGMRPQPTYREIARMLNMSERHVLRSVKAKTGEDAVAGAVKRLEREGLPMAVENTLAGLEAGDKEYTLEVLKGRGVLSTKPTDAGKGQAAFAGLIVQFDYGGQTPEPARPGMITATPDLRTAVIDVTPVPVPVPAAEPPRG